MKDFKQTLLKLCFIIVISGCFTAGITNLALAIDNEYNNQLMNISINKTGTDSVDVTVYSSKPYNMKITPVKRSNNEYVIVLPETYHSITSKPDISHTNGAVSDVDVKLLPYVEASSNNGYTRITIKTAPNVSINVHNKSVEKKQVVDTELMNIVNHQNSSSTSKQEHQAVKKVEKKQVTKAKTEINNKKENDKKPTQPVQKTQEVNIKPVKPTPEKAKPKPIKPVSKEVKKVVKEQTPKQKVLTENKPVQKPKTQVTEKKEELNSSKNIAAEVNTETAAIPEDSQSFIKNMADLARKYPKLTFIILGITSLIVIFQIMVKIFIAIATRKRNKTLKVHSGKNRMHFETNKSLYNPDEAERKLRESQEISDSSTEIRNRIYANTDLIENYTIQDTVSQEYRELEFPEEEFEGVEEFYIQETPSEEPIQNIGQYTDHDFDENRDSEITEEPQLAENYEVYEYGKSQPEFVEELNKVEEVIESEEETEETQAEHNQEENQIVQEEEPQIEQIQDEPEEEKDPEDELDVISEKEISEDKILYLVNFEGQLTLLGMLNSEVFVLHKFENELTKTNIHVRFNERRENKDIYLVQIGSWRALIGITDKNMQLLLTL